MDENNPNDAKVESYFKGFISECRRTFYLFIKVLKSPHRVILEAQRLSYLQMFLSYLILSLASTAVSFLFLAGFYFPYSLGLFSGIFSQIFLHAITLAVVWYVLQYLSQKITPKEYIEVWFLAWIPSLAAQFILGLWIPTGLWLISLSLFLPNLILVSLIYWASRQRWHLSQRPALIVAGIALIVLSIPTFQALNTWRTYWQIDQMYELEEDYDIDDEYEDFGGGEASEIYLRPKIREIAKEFSQGDEDWERAILQSARVHEAIATSLYPREELIRIRDLSRACISSLRADSKNESVIMYDIIEALNRHTYNTPERFRTYVAWNKSFSGKIYKIPLPDSNACE